MQVVAEGLAQPLVTWSTLALDVFPAWSFAWFTISGYSCKIVNTAPTPATAVRHRLLVFRANSAIANKFGIAHRRHDRSSTQSFQQEESSVSLLPRKLVLALPLSLIHI